MMSNVNDTLGLAMWEREVSEAEDEVSSVVEMANGISSQESIEEYADRHKAEIDIALVRLKYARDGLLAIQSKESSDLEIDVI